MAMKTLTTGFASALLALALAGPVSATPITLTPDDADGTSDETSASNEVGEINTALGTSLTSDDLLYKGEQDGDLEEGPFSSSYEIDWGYTGGGSDGADALLEYISGATITCGTECVFAVKDGKAEPAYYFFTGVDWDGMMDIQFHDMFPNKGSDAISHISIWGDSTPVPEPGTLALLGTALVGLGIARRRRTQ